MYIYYINKSEKKVRQFTVDTQFCAQCLLGHAENWLDNSLLDTPTQNFIALNRQSICENVRPNYSVFYKKYQNSFSKNLVIINDKASDVTSSFIDGFKKHFNISETINIYPATQYLNPNFHNHEETHKIDLQLTNDNDGVVVF